MGIGFNNDYNIDRNEWKTIRKEMKAVAKESTIDLSKANLKEIKSHIKAGNLGEYLDNVSKNMQGILGLKLTGKVDGTEDLDAAREMVEAGEFTTAPDGNPVDKAKVVQYILAANSKQIKNATTECVDLLTENNAKNTLNDIEQPLNKEFGIS